jgi:hypothetical protein
MLVRIPASGDNATTAVAGPWGRLFFVLGYGAALATWLLLAQTSEMWTGGGIVAAVTGLLLVLDLIAWWRGRKLVAYFGLPAVELDHHPLCPGDTVTARLELPLTRRTSIERAVLALACDVERLESWGSASERKVWRSVFRQPADVFTQAPAHAGVVHDQAVFAVPAEGALSGEACRWWLTLEVVVPTLPTYRASFPLRVVAPPSVRPRDARGPA